jgi:NitT/TauT family transport system permease protein
MILTEDGQWVGQRPSSSFDEDIIQARRRKKIRDDLLVITLCTSILLIVIGVWQIVHVTGLVKPIFISDPLSVANAVWTLLNNEATWRAIGATFQASLLGLIVGATLGIALGIPMAHVDVMRRALQPYLTIFNALPRPALAPIFILWFGLGTTPKVVVAATIVFFVLLANTMAGIRSGNADIAFLGRSLGMSKWQTFRMIELPQAMPAIIAGLRLGAVYAVLGVVVSEIVAAYEGLGQLLVRFTNQFSIAESFAVLSFMAALALILDFGVSLVQRRITWRSGTEMD